MDPERSRPWLAAYPPGVPPTYDHPDVPLTRLLDDAAKDFPEHEALHCLGYSLTYRRLLDKVDRFATALAGLGIARGDRVALVLPTSSQHVIGLFAVLRLGAVAVPLRPDASGDELVARIADAGASAVVCTDTGYAALAERRADLPTVRHLVVTALRDALPFPRNALHGLTGRRDGSSARVPAADGVHGFATLVARSAPTAVQTPVAADRDVAVVLYPHTGSSAGRGVALTHRNLVANAFQARLWIPDVVAGGEHLLCPLPLSSALGLLGVSLGVLSAATLTLLPRFDPAQALRTIARRRPTILLAVPALLEALRQAAETTGDADLRALRVTLSAGGPLPAELAAAFERLTGGKLRECYAKAEAGPLTHANPVYGRAKAGSVGLPVPDTDSALRDLDDPRRPAPPGHPGLLAVAGPQVMAGYWGRPEETAAVLVDGWLLTGDIAEVDADGYVRIVDRGRDVMVVDGRTVVPGRVEAALGRHPAVRRAVVAGVPDPAHGEAVKAYVVLEPQARVSPEALLASLRDVLDDHEVPTAIEVRPSLPATAVGRDLRRRLVAEELGRAREG